MNFWVPCNLTCDLVVRFEGCRLEGANELDELGVLAQRRELFILQRVLYVRIPFLSRLAQIKPAVHGISLASIHFRNHVMEVSPVAMSGQLDGDTARRAGIKYSRIKLHGGRIFLGRLVEIFAGEVGAAQVAVEAGAVGVDMDGSTILFDCGTILAVNVINHAQIVVAFGGVLIPLDFTLKFLFRIAVLPKLEQRDPNLIMEDGSVVLLQCRAVEIDGVEVVFLGTQAVSAKLQLLGAGGRRRGRYSRAFGTDEGLFLAVE